MGIRSNFAATFDTFLRSTMTLKADNFQVDCRPTENLHVTAVRYQPENPGPADGVTLVLAHGLGVHKVRCASFSRLVNSDSNCALC